ncbi:hypothetical protein KEM52_005027 [Ascosphaera acerosa]|nr:hypothetical protein KEM52_005027 [Ascosphaera acerosa]
MSTSNKLNYTPGWVEPLDHADYAHEDFLPAFPDVKWPPLEEVPYEDKGLLGDASFKILLADATEVFDITPRIGTEIRGVQLNRLSNDQRNDLARLLAVRGCVFFRDQQEFGIEEQRALGQYYGVLHKHATTALPRAPKNDDVHVVYAAEDGGDQRAQYRPSEPWHSDVTYELQPPSYTSLKLLTGPPKGGGGDTIWSSNYAAYDALSAHMQQYLKGLTALHSAERQAQGSRDAGRPVRREPVTTEHPLVRTNPVTGWNALMFNPGFVTQIVGVPKLESDMIIELLTTIVTTTVESQARFRWDVGAVALWDNRVCTHTATYGFAPHRRHAVRITPHGERPYLDPKGGSQEEAFVKAHGLKPISKNGAVRPNYND